LGDSKALKLLGVDAASEIACQSAARTDAGGATSSPQQHAAKKPAHNAAYRRSVSNQASASAMLAPFKMHESEWMRLLEGATEIFAKRGDSIIAQGSSVQRIYRIVSGSVTVTQVKTEALDERISQCATAAAAAAAAASVANDDVEEHDADADDETSTSSASGVLPAVRRVRSSTSSMSSTSCESFAALDFSDQNVISTIGRGQILGELSLLHQQPASASVVVTSDTAEFLAVEGYVLDTVFRLNSALAGRFFYHLCLTITDRLPK
jgi:CRP-like cAMP-binding protein